MRTAVLIVAASAHILVLTLIMGASMRAQDTPVTQAEPAIARIIIEPIERGTVPLPEAQMAPVFVDPANTLQVRFEDPDDDDLSGVIGSASAPRLSRVQAVDPSVFARRAGLAVGQAVTVILALDITPEGWVISAHVTRSSGNPAADAAAVDYALSLHWIPGTRDRVPRTMRVSFPVTLTRAN